MDVAFMVILGFVAYQDIRKMKIRDKSILAIIILTILSLLFTSEISLWERLLGTLCVSLPMLLAATACPGALGGGDIKLMAAGGLFLGRRLILQAAVIALVTAAVYAVYLLVIERKDGKTKIPLGPFLCIGMALAQICN